MTGKEPDENLTITQGKCSVLEQKYLLISTGSSIKKRKKRVFYCTRVTVIYEMKLIGDDNCSDINSDVY